MLQNIERRLKQILSKIYIVLTRLQLANYIARCVARVHLEDPMGNVELLYYSYLNSERLALNL